MTSPHTISPIGRSPSGSADRNGLRYIGRVIADWSLPIRERGSKLTPMQVCERLIGRRSPSGSADRNLRDSNGNKCGTVSLPIRERGSKPPGERVPGAFGGSLPIRERGSKPGGREIRPHVLPVAPHPGARIETIDKRPMGEGFESLPIRERGSKRPTQVLGHGRLASLPIRERGSKPQARCRPALPAWRRSPSGSADRNLGDGCLWRDQAPVAPHPGARIETPDRANCAKP